MSNLTSPTNSLVNNIYANSKHPAPEIGMGCTILGWTDRHAATIIEIEKDGKRIGIRQDIAARVDKNGMSESQDYEYSPGNGAVRYYTLRKNGRYVHEGEALKNGETIAVGFRREYYDFCF